MRGGINSGHHRFRRRFVGVSVESKDVGPEGDTLSSLGVAGSTSPSQLAMSQWGWSFHTVQGGLDPGISAFVPVVF